MALPDDELDLEKFREDWKKELKTFQPSQIKTSDITSDNKLHKDNNDGLFNVHESEKASCSAEKSDKPVIFSTSVDA